MREFPLKILLDTFSLIKSRVVDYKKSYREKGFRVFFDIHRHRNISSLEDDACSLGKIVWDLLELELLARCVLMKSSDDANKRLIELLNESKGNFVEVDPFTNWDSLRPVLKEYNKKKPNHEVDIKKIVHLRDSLAHGRMFFYGSPREPGPLRLLRFSNKPKEKKVSIVASETLTKEWFGKNMVLIVASETLTKEWFDENMEFLNGEINKVRESAGWGRDDVPL